MCKIPVTAGNDRNNCSSDGIRESIYSPEAETPNAASMIKKVIRKYVKFVSSLDSISGPYICMSVMFFKEIQAIDRSLFGYPH